MTISHGLQTMTRAALILYASAAAAAAPKYGYAPVNGARMYYEIHGKGRPLVLLHGGGSTIETSFARLLPAFSRTRQVIAFEQQGHGRTADVEGRPFSFEQSADDAAALLRHLRIEQADILGFSNGGSIALQVAIRHPELVRKMVVISAIYARSGMTPEFWQSMEHASLDSMPAELKQAYVAVAPHPEQLQTFHDKSVKRMLEFKGWPPEMIRGIQAPTMVIVADGDVVRPEHAVEMFRLLPHGELAIVPGATHALIVENADLLAAMILPFLDARQENPSRK
jgi:pimeloyl-ACP methyl ester carboxylesterase